jgi:hypothetical protein
MRFILLQYTVYFCNPSSTCHHNVRNEQLDKVFNNDWSVVYAHTSDAESAVVLADS